MKKTYIILIIVAVFCAFYSHESKADVRDLSVGALVELGVMEFERGDLGKAAHEFSKALMIQPENEGVKQWLDKCGLAKGLYAPDQDRVWRKENNSTQKQATHVAGASFAYPANVYDAIPGEDSYAQFSDRFESDVHLLSQEVSQLKWDLQKGNVAPTKEFMHVFNVDMPRSSEEEYAAAIEQAFDHEKEIQELDRKYAHLRARSQYLYVHQDKLIHVLEDYLYQREGSLNRHKDALVMQEISIARTIQRLLTKLDEVIEQQDSINQYLSQIDEQDFFAQREKEVQSIRADLSAVSSELAKHDASEIARKVRLSQLEQTLKHTEERVAFLLEKE